MQRILQGQWIKVSTTNKAFAGFVALINFSAFFAGMGSSHGALIFGGTKVVNGQAAIGVVDTSKSGGGTLWIAKTGTPYPLQLTQRNGPGVLIFEGWDTPMHITAPSNSINLTKLTK